MLVKRISIPIIVKEIGSGISKDVARRLIDVGVRIIDVAGAGGTSWAGVEIIRNKKRDKNPMLDWLWDWGIPTADALKNVCELKNNMSTLKVISSGGIKNGLEIAKSIALGADYAAVARPILKAVVKGGKKAGLNLIDAWQKELESVMFLTGSDNISRLQKQKLVYRLENKL
jgi:isopentenyl-diphosphate delta-isomerase